MEWQVPGNIEELQRSDPSLAPCFLKMNSSTKTPLESSERYLLENGVLYVKSDTENRLVVPTVCRMLVLHIAHSIPWAGHLGQGKTLARIESMFLLAFYAQRHH